MSLPINVDDLLHGHVVEWERIEFKEGWNDLDILHTICAFANDFRNLGGGYIVIGVEEREGRPVFPPKGLDPAQAGKIQSDLLNLCKKRIKNEYTPYVEPVTFQRKLILVIWCPGGMDRPYEVPDSFAKGAPRNYYIRKFNNTIKPNKEEKQELLRFAAIPFDDRTNYQHTYKDLSRFWVGVFLQDIGSKLIEEFDDMPFLTICRQMNLVHGPDEFIRPKNFALLFFNLHPEKIFPMAQIEVVNFQTRTADSDFSEIYFKGPLQYQLKEVLGYFKTYVVKELVRKVSYQAQALRNFNFPYEALEEAVANAVLCKGLHKNAYVN